MTVIINDFEVIPESNQEPSESSDAQTPSVEQPSVPDIERVVNHLKERAKRIWAH